MSITRADWPTMTRDELLAEKVRLDASLSHHRLEIATAKRRARAQGIYLPVDQLTEMEERVRTLAAASGALGLEIHRRKRAERPFNDDVHDAFKELADDGFYALVLERARELQAERRAA